MIDPEKVLKGFQWRSRPHVFSPKLCNATTLPLYFYLGYQILQEQNLMKQCDHVRLTFIKKMLKKHLSYQYPIVEGVYRLKKLFRIILECW